MTAFWIPRPSGCGRGCVKTRKYFLTTKKSPTQPLVGCVQRIGFTILWCAGRTLRSVGSTGIFDRAFSHSLGRKETNCHQVSKLKVSAVRAAGAPGRVCAVPIDARSAGARSRAWPSSLLPRRAPRPRTNRERTVARWRQTAG